MAINNALYSASGTSGTTYAALSTANPEQYDSVQLYNDDGSIVQYFQIKGQDVKVLANSVVSIDIRCSPNSVKLKSASGTPAYRVIMVGR